MFTWIDKVIEDIDFSHIYLMIALNRSAVWSDLENCLFFLPKYAALVFQLGIQSPCMCQGTGPMCVYIYIYFSNFECYVDVLEILDSL